MNKQFNVVDLFSGAGGLSEGFRSNKFNIICHVEMDKDACDTLALRNVYYYLKHIDNIGLYYDYVNHVIDKNQLMDKIPPYIINNVLNYKIDCNTSQSIYKYIDDSIGNNSVDGIIGGPPCQAYSIVGRVRNKSKKEHDDRIYLYRYYKDFINRYKPSFFVFENVKGLLSFRDCSDRLLFPQIINEFSELGYDVTYKVINASLYGVPQNRERVILFGKNRNKNLGDFFKALENYTEKPPTIKEIFDDLPFLKSGDSSNVYSKCCTSNFVKKYYRTTSRSCLTYHSARRNNENDSEIYKLVVQYKIHGKSLKYNELPDTLKTHNNVTSFLDRYKALDYDNVSHTVVAHLSKDGHYYIHPDILQNRSITVREAARIQGFPDDFYFENSRTAAFKQIGNAVPPILSKKLAQAVVKIFTD